jgi:hypothetical protein
MANSKSATKVGLLTLGWTVDEASLAPLYWYDSGAKPGNQSDDQLVRVPADTVGCHTAIIAQSGSGKSFFLGRLVEELMLATRARCVILDPNADFRRVAEIVDADLWKKASYDPIKRRGFLPSEANLEAFAEKWNVVPKELRGGSKLKSEGAVRLKVDWSLLSHDLLADDILPMLRSDLYHCHEFVKAILGLLRVKYRPKENDKKTIQQGTNPDLMEQVISILRQLRSISSDDDRRDFLNSKFNVYGITDSKKEQQAIPNVSILRKWIAQQGINRAIAACSYISDEVSRYYFGKAREYTAQGIVDTTIFGETQGQKRVRLDVIDLPSLPEGAPRLLVLNSVLETIWRRARAEWAAALEKPERDDQRVPTFIVVDEAHNLVPRDPVALGPRALLEQFRTIAAEGRKYGLFLILCTQRPDKIDPLVLSECENYAVMRLGSRSVLDEAKKLFGLEDMYEPKLSRCLTFDKGRAVIIGRWAKEPVFLYTAMRRTVEGGRSLREEYWGEPLPPSAKPAATEPTAPS